MYKFVRFSGYLSMQVCSHLEVNPSVSNSRPHMSGESTCHENGQSLSKKSATNLKIK